MARTRTKHFVPYNHAVRIVQEKGIRHRNEYWRWHRKEKPNYLPKHPHNHYKEWTSWNDFLGNQNTFVKNTKKKKKLSHIEGGWRPYWDAVRWAQAFAKKHNITNSDQWKTMYSELNVPDDIPQYPYQVYDEFKWTVWLGKNLEAKIANATSNIGIFAFHHVKGQPQNVIRMMVWKDGYHSMLSKINDYDLDLPIPKCMWVLTNDAMTYADSLLKHHGHQRGNDWIVPNPGALLWGMMDCEMYIHNKERRND